MSKKKIKKALKRISSKNKYAKSIAENLSAAVRRAKMSKYQAIYGVDEKLVVFEAFSGGKYACNPMAIYEAMLKDPKYDDFEYVWIFNKPKKYKFLEDNKNTTVVKKFSDKHYESYAKAKYWVNNMSIPEYLHPSKEQVYIETWHGVPLKRMGFDIETDVDPRQTKSHMRKKYKHKAQKMTYMISSSEFYTEKLTSSFGLDKFCNRDIFLNTGYPRNDFLFHYTKEDVKKWKEELGIAEDKKVVLYTPTWRDTQYTNGKITYQVEVDLDQLSKELGDDYVILFRAHHHVKKVEGAQQENTNVINVANIDEINFLYIISDILITDYSSTMFDFAILNRPMVFFMYDLEEYANDVRGFYFDIAELPGPIVQETSKLAGEMKKALNVEEYQKAYGEKYKAFNEKFNQYNHGDSAHQLLEQVINTEFSEDYYQKREQNIKRWHKWLEMKNQLRCFKYNVKGLLRLAGICTDENSRKLRKLKNSHKGERCFLIGNGPSLTPQDLDLLQNETCFACNMIFEIFDKTKWRPTYYCVYDNVYSDKLEEQLHDSLAVTENMFTIPGFYKKLSEKPENMIYIDSIFSEEYSVRGNVLAYVKRKATVMTIMAEMAFYLGFKEIYLIGVDNSDTHGSGGHFYQNETEKVVAARDINRIKRRLSQEKLTSKDIAEHTMTRCNSVYEEMKKYADKHGIKMYNATRGGKLEVFERANLDEVVADKQGK